MRLLLIWLSGLGVPTAALGAPAGHFQGLCFPSGFKLGVEQRPGQPLVGMAMVVGGGSSTERANEQGVAHLVEHLWFRRPSGPFDTFSHELDHLGAWANAFTSHDETVYLTVAHTRTLKQLVRQEALRLRAPLQDIDEARVSAEREVVRAEIRQRYDGAAPVLGAIFSATMDQAHPYARSVAGTDDEVQRLHAHGGARVRVAYLPARQCVAVRGRRR